MNTFVWTDADLDGAGAYVVMCWLYGKELPYKCSRISQATKQFAKWYEANGDKYDRIYVLDLDASGNIEAFDHDNVVIIDHHKLHFERKGDYKKAKPLVKVYPSTTKLIYDLFKDKFNLTKYQKFFIALVNDYDSYTLDFKQSMQLNWWFWEVRGDRVKKVYEAFKDGFNGFDKFQQHIIEMFSRKVDRLLESCPKYVGSIEYDGETYKILGTELTEGINEVLHRLIQEYDVDIGFCYNENTNSLSFRRHDNCTVPLHQLASDIANGGGHEAAAGGSPDTEEFIALTKSLKEV